VACLEGLDGKLGIEVGVGIGQGLLEDMKREVTIEIERELQWGKSPIIIDHRPPSRSHFLILFLPLRVFLYMYTSNI
jgi:hypothetical protein